MLIAKINPGWDTFIVPNSEWKRLYDCSERNLIPVTFGLKHLQRQKWTNLDNCFDVERNCRRVFNRIRLVYDIAMQSNCDEDSLEIPLFMTKFCDGIFLCHLFVDRSFSLSLCNFTFVTKSYNFFLPPFSGIMKNMELLFSLWFYHLSISAFISLPLQCHLIDKIVPSIGIFLGKFISI